MSYNLKNKNIVMIAFVFAVLMTMSRPSHAEDAVPFLGAETPAAEAPSDDLFGLDMENEDEAGAVSDTSAGSAETAEIPTAAPQEADLFSEAEPNLMENSTNNDALQDIPGAASSDDSALLDNVPADSVENAPTEPENIPVAEAPKSPFESFGNAILSKVDNDLFNQMSNIEKQTTLLNLELKREEVRDRIDALKQKRVMAQEQEAMRKREMEQKLKEEELEKQTLLMAEQQKLKEKEIELEKVRQAKVLNEYMNEMLVMNQDWIAKNSSLHTRIKELEEERRSLVKDFEDKLATLRREAVSANKKAEAAIAAYDRTVTSYNSQIALLKQSIIESEDRLKQVSEGNANQANPFADMSLSGLDENAIDMSQEYAIMDITGKGNDIIAKIVSKDGTTFIIHKGSMLKGGEVVTAITDNYVAFDNKGVKSYLYTGGTVMEYEPVVTFNGSDKTPETTEKQIIKPEIHNVRGAASTSTGTPSAAARQKAATQAATENKTSAKASAAKTSAPAVKTAKRSSRKNESSDLVSFGQGMFVK